MSPARSNSNLELLLATGNRGKAQEIRQALQGLPLRLSQLDEFPNVSSVEEDGVTYRDNAVLKALGYSKQTGLFALADDSGLEVDALAGAPGPLSARFAGEFATDQKRIQKLLFALEEQSLSLRTARFVCCIALAGWVSQEQDPENNLQLISLFEGKCEGSIANVPRGSNGFGYDPIFIPTGYAVTFAELPSEVKDRISHRAKALAMMRQFLEVWLEGPNLTAHKTAT